jgi:DNA modification methylase
MSQWQVLHGDVRERLAELPAQSVQCVVTSPPYWGLRDYGHTEQIGLEMRPDDYVAVLVSVFQAVRRVLSADGSLWLNLGDSYSQSGRGGNPKDSPHRKQATNRGSISVGSGSQLNAGFHETARQAGVVSRAWSGRPPEGLKPKELVGIPWRVAFALQADGWYLRSDIIWSKPNPMPESVTDRPTKAHEYIFLLTKNARYYYNAAAIREPLAESTLPRYDRAQSGYAPPGQTAHRGIAGPRERRSDKQRGHGRRHAGFNDRWDAMPKDEQQIDGANKRSVWHVATSPYPDAHFATYPEKLIEPCILAGSRPGDTVLDPFTGSGTTGAVAIRHQRNFIGIELNADYVQLARTRIGAVAPLFADEASA